MVNAFFQLLGEHLKIVGLDYHMSCPESLCCYIYVYCDGTKIGHVTYMSGDDFVMLTRYYRSHHDRLNLFFDGFDFDEFVWFFK